MINQSHLDGCALQEVVLSIHSIWGAPIYILSIMALLYREIQWASLVGLGVLLVMVPISGFIGRGLGKQRRAIIKFIDRRTSFMAEIINGIRVIKFYNWEQPFKCVPPPQHGTQCCAPCRDMVNAWPARVQYLCSTHVAASVPMCPEFYGLSHQLCCDWQ